MNRLISSTLVGTTFRFELDIFQTPGKYRAPGSRIGQKIVENLSNFEPILIHTQSH